MDISAILYKMQQLSMRVITYVPPLKVNRIQAQDKAVMSLDYNSNGLVYAYGIKAGCVTLCETLLGETLGVLQGHVDVVQVIRFSPDDSYLASGSGDKTIRIWNGLNSQCEAILKGHTGGVSALVFSADGSMLCSSSNGGRDHSIRIWNMFTRDCVTIFNGHTDCVPALAICGTLLISCSKDSKVNLWNLNNGQCLTTLQGQSRTAIAVAAHPSGSMFASVFGEKSINIYEAKKGCRCLRTLKGHSGYVVSLTFNTSGSLLASGSFQEVRIWDFAKGSLFQVLENRSDFIWSLAFSPDGSRLASSSDDGIVVYA